MNSQANNKGFTLIEVLIATVIVTVAIGVLMQLFGSGLDRLKRVSNGFQQILIEREMLSQLRFNNFYEASSGEGRAMGVSYTWTASPLSALRLISPDLGEVLYPQYVGLYLINVEFVTQQNQFQSVEFKGLGWKTKKE